jgi:pyridoxal 5'-phosphate synthase pdxT subunit
VAGKQIGILALQGDVSLHAQALAKLGAETRSVKLPSDLKGLHGLIIPGGESTALLKLMKPVGMLDAIKDFAKAGNSIFGTCAGAILLAKDVTHPKQESLNLIDISIKRNGYGRQVDSFEAIGDMNQPLGKGKLPMTFIRAPRIIKIAPGVKILAEHEGEPVLVMQDNILTGTFHPELTDSLTSYEYWLNQI